MSSTTGIGKPVSLSSSSTRYWFLFLSCWLWPNLRSGGQSLNQVNQQDENPNMTCDRSRNPRPTPGLLGCCSRAAGCSRTCAAARGDNICLVRDGSTIRKGSCAELRRVARQRTWTMRQVCFPLQALMAKTGAWPATSLALQPGIVCSAGRHIFRWTHLKPLMAKTSAWPASSLASSSIGSGPRNCATDGNNSTQTNYT